uniref:Uncharacterized protein n=1 Tax=Nelumbo nucifera TaxID=4432 RepID=A0A822YZM2_NELNU|nr:TPA_asm: hypothetical protein HUJ06_006846 [Nelumbo nucifera]
MIFISTSSEAWMWAARGTKNRGGGDGEEIERDQMREKDRKNERRKISPLLVVVAAATVRSCDKLFFLL